jgi:hypothetical protein
VNTSSLLKAAKIKAKVAAAEKKAKKEQLVLKRKKEREDKIKINEKDLKR